MMGYNVRHFSISRSCNVDLNELERAKKANEELLEKSDRDRLDVRSDLERANTELHGIQVTHYPNLSDDERERIFTYTMEKIAARERKIDEIDSMDPDDIKTEVKEASKEFSVTSFLTDLTRGIDSMISPVVGDMGDRYNQLQETRDEIDMRARYLHDKHIDLINKEIDLSNQIAKHKSDNSEGYLDGKDNKDKTNTSQVAESSITNQDPESSTANTENNNPETSTINQDPESSTANTENNNLESSTTNPGPESNSTTIDYILDKMEREHNPLDDIGED